MYNLKYLVFITFCGNTGCNIFTLMGHSGDTMREVWELWEPEIDEDLVLRCSQVCFASNADVKLIKIENKIVLFT